jgi:CRP-like cAMP-binding protein
VGNIFYIITEGSCKVTLDTEDWKEKEVNRMHPGDCFGKT